MWTIQTKVFYDKQIIKLFIYSFAFRFFGLVHCASFSFSSTFPISGFQRKAPTLLKKKLFSFDIVSSNYGCFLTIQSVNKYFYQKWKMHHLLFFTLSTIYLILIQIIQTRFFCTEFYICDWFSIFLFLFWKKIMFFFYLTMLFSRKNEKSEQEILNKIIINW